MDLKTQSVRNDSYNPRKSLSSWVNHENVQYKSIKENIYELCLVKHAPSLYLYYCRREMMLRENILTNLRRESFGTKYLPIF